jgi:hypothetical protein
VKWSGHMCSRKHGGLPEVSSPPRARWGIFIKNKNLILHVTLADLMIFVVKDEHDKTRSIVSITLCFE